MKSASAVKRMRLGWFFPVLTVVLCTFVLVAAQSRRRTIISETRRDLEMTVEFAVNDLLGCVQRSSDVTSLVEALVEGHLGDRERRRLHERIGIGLLLHDPSRLHVEYLVIQDESGILAGSPISQELSGWRDDPLLAVAQARPEGQILFREIEYGDAQLFEGVTSFHLPEGTTLELIGAEGEHLVMHAGRPLVLRVGVDATDETVSMWRWIPRIWIVTVLSSLLMLTSVVVTVFLRRGEKHRLAAERAVATQEAEARHWQAIGEMAATVAHEVRNPLNTIGMAAQRLEREFEISEEDQEDFEELTSVMKSEADRVGVVVKEFLELGRPLNLDLKSLPGGEAVLEAARPLQLRAEQEDKHLIVECDYDGDLRVDKHRLAQIVGNLVGNALDAVEKGGTVKVCLDTLGDDVRLLVEDDGEGMGAETLERVQQPFVTMKVRGTGLGLPLSRRLVEAHGGRLVFSSTSGEGTRAEVLLPRDFYRNPSLDHMVE